MDYVKNKYGIEANDDICDAICISEVLKFDNSILQDKNKMNFK